MRAQLAWLAILPTLVPLTSATAADGIALLNRMHVGRVKSVDPGGGRVVVEGMFHDRSFREISVSLEADAPVIDPNVTNRTQRVARKDIRPGYYVALECTESGKRHAARKVTITSTEQEEKLQRAFLRASRGAPPGLRGTGSGPR
ncbi:MAG: hypothetical protein HYZ03_04550 [candidate division NC10 bacterium]|nr:hypothetical protein [candidate division NC10 bacterium]